VFVGALCQYPVTEAGQLQALNARLQQYNCQPAKQDQWHVEVQESR